MDEATPEFQHISKLWEKTQGRSPIYDLLLRDQNLEFVAASRGYFKAYLTIGPNHVNSRKTIHGAVSAAIVDWAGGFAIATHGFEKTGTSVDIHVTYISTAEIGDTIMIEGTANKVGRAMAFTTVKITKLVDGQPGPVVVTASHTKYISHPLVSRESQPV